MNVAIKFEQALQKNIQSATVIVDNRANDEQEYNLHFKKTWPLCLYLCQTTDKYEIMFMTIPRFRLSRNYFLGQQASEDVWKVVSILASIQEVWDLVINVQFRCSQWHGWLLHYMGKKMFPTITPNFSKKYPFSFIEIITIPKIIEKFNFHNSDILYCNSIKILQDFDLLDIVDSNTDQVIIIDSCNQFNYEERPKFTLETDSNI